MSYSVSSDLHVPDLARHFISEGNRDFVTMYYQLVVLDELIKLGHVQLTEIEVPFADDPSREHVDYSIFARAFVKQTPVKKTGGYSRSGYHSRLKWTGFSWLRSLGEPTPLYEHSFKLSYGVTDVYAPVLNVIVECGNTEPAKVVAAFESETEWAHRLVILPFAWDTENGGRSYTTIRASCFESNEAGREAIRSHRSTAHETLRSIYMRPRYRGRPRKHPK